MPSWGKKGRYGGFLRLCGAIFHRALAFVMRGRLPGRYSLSASRRLQFLSESARPPHLLSIESSGQHRNRAFANCALTTKSMPDTL